MKEINQSTEDCTIASHKTTRLCISFSYFATKIDISISSLSSAYAQYHLLLLPAPPTCFIIPPRKLTINVLLSLTIISSLFSPSQLPTYHENIQSDFLMHMLCSIPPHLPNACCIEAASQAQTQKSKKQTSTSIFSFLPFPLLPPLQSPLFVVSPHSRVTYDDEKSPKHEISRKPPGKRHVCCYTLLRTPETKSKCIKTRTRARNSPGPKNHRFHSVESTSHHIVQLRGHEAVVE
jgi:hypothetical protein